MTDTLQLARDIVAGHRGSYLPGPREDDRLHLARTLALALVEKHEECERLSLLGMTFDIVANGGAFQVVLPPHVVAGFTTISERIYIVRESDLQRALDYSGGKS